MKYMVMTTKHHEGFSLWNSKTNPYNAVNYGPKRDLVLEYVEACREYGLKVGFYHSLMDWHHPDGANCAKDEAARKRFTEYIRECARELCTNYGKIDIFWHDVSWPLTSPELWESEILNGMISELQPGILINNRAQLPADFGTPEEQIVAEGAGRDWEACMTFNGSWGYMPYALDEDWHSSRKVVDMLRTVTAGGGNLLLNIGPEPDGTIPPLAIERLAPVGKWLEKYGEAVYGSVDRADKTMEWMPLGQWTVKGNTGYFWVTRWAGKELYLGGVNTKVKSACLLDSGKPVTVEQSENRLILRDLPEKAPDDLVHVSVIKIEFEGKPEQKLGAGCVIL